MSDNITTQPTRRSCKRIACEEGYMIPEVMEAYRRFYERGSGEAIWLAEAFKTYSSEEVDEWMAGLLDLGDGRINLMNAAGIDAQILLLSIQGVQPFDAVEAGELAQLANERLAQAMTAHPSRLYGLAAIAPQDPARAACEIERAVTKLGLKGAMVNGHTAGERLDHIKFRPIFEALSALDVPLYLHPREAPIDSLHAHLPYALEGPVWGFASETGLHALRLIFSGLFDEYPNLKIALGHCGEGIPFYLHRLDERAAVEGNGVRGRAALKLKPSEYFKNNFVITTSGMNTVPTVRYCQEVLGSANVLFAVDYPFERNLPAVKAMEEAGFSDDLYRKFYQTNAEKVFKLCEE